MAIYNSWGTRVFETTDFYQGWDCTFKGITVQLGVYMYIFRAINNEDIFEKKGTVTIIG